VFEGAAGDLVTETDQYYQRLTHNLKHMATGRGYDRYFESWKPADISEGDIMVEDLRGMFVETRIDPRIESALPMLAKIQQEAKAMKEADIFESWAARLVEGTWALPDTPEKMTEIKTWFGQPQPLGPDAENVTDVLYPLLGDDALFDQLAAMAAEDPDADAIPIVQAWVTRNRDQSPELSELAASFETTAPEAPVEPAPAAAPAAPEAPAPAPPPVAEGDNLETFEDIIRLSGAPINENVLNDSGSTLDYIIKTYQRDVKDFVQNGDMSELLYDALYDYYQDDMPYGVKKARTGDPYEWVGQRFYNDLQGSDMVDEDRPRSKQMRRMPPGGYSIKNTEIDSDARRVAGIDLIQNPEMTIGLDAPQWDYPSIQPTNPAATDMSTHTQDQRDRLLRIAGDDEPMDECNYTMENRYCPKHGLEDCGTMSMFESDLARIKSLAQMK
jgi:predicted flap endonuclease-1-like 5' DNA nuclease